MSLLFLVLFVAAVKSDVAILEEGFMYAWALFSIADALWVRTIFRRTDNA